MGDSVHQDKKEEHKEIKRGGGAHFPLYHSRQALLQVVEWRSFRRLRS